MRKQARKIFHILLISFVLLVSFGGFNCNCKYAFREWLCFRLSCDVFSILILSRQSQGFFLPERLLCLRPLESFGSLYRRVVSRCQIKSRGSLILDWVVVCFSIMGKLWLKVFSSTLIGCWNLLLLWFYDTQSKSTVVYAYCLHLSSINNSGSVKTRSFSSLLKCGSRFSFEGTSDAK